MLEAFFPYSQRSDDIIVRVAVNFQAKSSDPATDRWFWAYHIRIENHGASNVQLLTRRWEIADARGALNLVEGPGVIGEQPVIGPGGSYDYVSGCPLTTPIGHMAGSFGMIDTDGQRFSVAIPAFPLHSPAVIQ